MIVVNTIAEEEGTDPQNTPGLRERTGIPTSSPRPTKKPYAVFALYKYYPFYWEDLRKGEEPARLLLPGLRQRVRHRRPRGPLPATRQRTQALTCGPGDKLDLW